MLTSWLAGDPSGARGGSLPAGRDMRRDISPQYLQCSGGLEGGTSASWLLIASSGQLTFPPCGHITTTITMGTTLPQYY